MNIRLLECVNEGSNECWEVDVDVESSDLIGPFLINDSEGIPPGCIDDHRLLMSNWP